MDLIFLVALSLAVGLAAWLFFLWSVKSGQYDDPEGPKYRMLEDDDDGEPAAGPKLQVPEDDGDPAAGPKHRMPDDDDDDGEPVSPAREPTLTGAPPAREEATHDAARGSTLAAPAREEPTSSAVRRPPSASASRPPLSAQPERSRGAAKSKDEPGSSWP